MVAAVLSDRADREAEARILKKLKSYVKKSIENLKELNTDLMDQEIYDIHIKGLIQHVETYHTIEEVIMVANHDNTPPSIPSGTESDTNRRDSHCSLPFQKKSFKGKIFVGSRTQTNSNIQSKSTPVLPSSSIDAVNWKAPSPSPLASLENRENPSFKPSDSCSLSLKTSTLIKNRSKFNNKETKFPDAEEFYIKTICEKSFSGSTKEFLILRETYEGNRHYLDYLKIEGKQMVEYSNLIYLSTTRFSKLLLLHKEVNQALIFQEIKGQYILKVLPLNNLEELKKLNLQVVGPPYQHQSIMNSILSPSKATLAVQSSPNQVSLITNLRSPGWYNPSEIQAFDYKFQYTSQIDRLWVWDNHDTSDSSSHSEIILVTKSSDGFFNLIKFLKMKESSWKDNGLKMLFGRSEKHRKNAKVIDLLYFNDVLSIFYLLEEGDDQIAVGVDQHCINDDLKILTTDTFTVTESINNKRNHPYSTFLVPKQNSSSHFLCFYNEHCLSFLGTLIFDFDEEKGYHSIKNITQTYDRVGEEGMASEGSAKTRNYIASSSVHVHEGNLQTADIHFFETVNFGKGSGFSFAYASKQYESQLRELSVHLNA